MKSAMTQIKPHIDAFESYKAIVKEQLSSVVIDSQVLSGSIIRLSSYNQVVFTNCVFYACDFKDNLFKNCIFENCSFEFSHIRESQFKNCNFTDCNWIASSSIDCIYENCDIGPEIQNNVFSTNNKILASEEYDYTTDIYIQLAVA